MKRVKLFIFGLFIFILGNNTVFAGTYASINSNSSVVQGNTISVTGTISSNSALFFIEGTLKCSGAGVNKNVEIKLETMDNNKKSQASSIKITPTQTGTITCTVSGRASGAESSNWQNVSASKTINVVKPREKSNNNNLKGLGIEGYQITPEFNKDTLEYSSEIPSSVEKINIQADREDGYANLDGNGEKEVKEGLNKFEIKVTSETGKEKVYTLNVNLIDKDPIEKEVNGKKYNIVKRASTLELPEGVDKEAFTLSTVKINDVDIPVYTSESLKLTLIGLKDTNGNVYLYKYENDKITDKYETITSKALSILITDPKEEIDKYTKTTIKIDSKEYTAYQNDNKNYALIYGTNLENDVTGWYQYNIKENSIQLFDIDTYNFSNKDTEKTINEYKVVILVLSGLSIFLLLLALVEMRSKGKLKKKLRLLKKENKNIEEPKKEEVKVEEIKEEPIAKKIEETTEPVVEEKIEDTNEIMSQEFIDEIKSSNKKKKKK